MVEPQFNVTLNENQVKILSVLLQTCRLGNNDSLAADLLALNEMFSYYEANELCATEIDFSVRVNGENDDFIMNIGGNNFSLEIRESA